MQYRLVLCSYGAAKIHSPQLARPTYKVPLSTVCLGQDKPTNKKVWRGQSGVGEQKETGGKKWFSICYMLKSLYLVFK